MGDTTWVCVADKDDEVRIEPNQTILRRITAFMSVNLVK